MHDQVFTAWTNRNIGSPEERDALNAVRARFEECLSRSLPSCHYAVSQVYGCR
jgi:hypothetical protein